MTQANQSPFGPSDEIDFVQMSTPRSRTRKFKARPRAKENDTDSDDELDMEFEGFNPAFDIGDVVRVRGYEANPWDEYMPDLGGFYSNLS
ncbi:hypothetical protein RBB50_007531 [Rhinocladiella similis]